MVTVMRNLHSYIKGRPKNQSKRVKFVGLNTPYLRREIDHFLSTLLWRSYFSTRQCGATHKLLLCTIF